MVLRQIPPMTNDIPHCIQQRAVTVLKIAKLLKSGADFNIHSDDRKTPLDQAALTLGSSVLEPSYTATRLRRRLSKAYSRPRQFSDHKIRLYRSDSTKK